MDQTIGSNDTAGGVYSFPYCCLNFSLIAHLQRALANQPWKEYTAPGGRKYWYNTETKQSSWEMPEVYKNAQAQAQTQAQPTPKPTPAYVSCIYVLI